MSNLLIIFNICIQWYSFHRIRIIVNWIFSELGIIISILKSSDIEKPLKSLRKLNRFIFLISYVLHRTTLQKLGSKNIFYSFSGRTDVLRFEYLLLFLHFHHTFLYGCLRSRVILLSFLADVWFNIILVHIRNFYFMHILYS